MLSTELTHCLDELKQLKELNPKFFLYHSYSYYDNEASILIPSLFSFLGCDINEKNDLRDDFFKVLTKLKFNYERTNENGDYFFSPTQSLKFSQGYRLDVLLSWAKDEALKSGYEDVGQFIKYLATEKIKGDKKLGEYDVIEDLIKDNGCRTRNTLAEAFLQSAIPKILETNILEVYNFINKDEFLELLKLKEQRMQMQKEETMKNDEIEIFNALLNDDVTLIKPSQKGIKAYYDYQAYAQNLVKEAKLEFSIEQREFLKEIYKHLSLEKYQYLKSYKSYVESKKYKAEKYGFDSDLYYQMKKFILNKQEFFDYVLDSTDIPKEILEDLKEKYQFSDIQALKETFTELNEKIFSVYHYFIIENIREWEREIENDRYIKFEEEKRKIIEKYRTNDEEFLDSTDIPKEILEDLKEIDLEDNLSNLINKVDNAQAIQEARIASYISNDDTSNVLENEQSSSNINRLYRK